MEKAFRFSNIHTDFQARDAKSVFGWRYSPRIIFKAGKGTKLVDLDGNEYYDLTSGMMCMVLGHSHPELTEVIREMAGAFLHQSSWYSNPWIVEFAELLGANTPGDLKVVNFAVTGSEANEIAMRMALAATGQVRHCLHDPRIAWRQPRGGGADQRRRQSQKGSRATDVSGEVQCSAAALLLSLSRQSYLSRLRRGLPARQRGNARVRHQPGHRRRHGGDHPSAWRHDCAAQGVAATLVATGQRWGALLVLDECQLAPARTGKMWAMEHYGVTPDIVTWGKGLSAGLAICGTITTPEIAEKVRGQCGLPWGGTYSGDPLSAAVALKQLQIVLRDKLDERAEALGQVAERELAALADKYECIGDVRGKGLYRMLDIVKDKKSKAPDPVMAERIRYNAALEGVISIAVKHYFRFAPPLIITEAEIKDMVGRLEVAIQRALAGFPKDIDFREFSSLAVGDRPVAAE